MSRGADIRANTRSGGALERGHRAPREPLTQLGDALSGVGAFAVVVEAAELVVVQAARGGARWIREQACQWALTERRLEVLVSLSYGDVLISNKHSPYF